MHSLCRPQDALNAILAAASAFMQVSPRTLPQIILVGAAGVSRPYACCDGILVVESLGDFRSVTGAPTSAVTGEPCDAGWLASYRVTVTKCAPAFDNESASGAAPKSIEHSTLATNLVIDSWAFLESLRCQLSVYDCVSHVIAGGHRIESGCARFWADITWEHTLCC